MQPGCRAAAHNIELGIPKKLGISSFLWPLGTEHFSVWGLQQNDLARIPCNLKQVGSSENSDDDLL